MRILYTLVGVFLTFSHLGAESPQLTPAGDPFIYADLKKGDSRNEVLQKLREGGFIQIYEERDKGLVRCTIKWDDMRYELVCKLVNNKLTLCLIESQRGWQDFFYEDVVRPQWEMLRKRLIKNYGEDRKHTKFPSLDQVPLDDMGGYITDTWNLSDRTLIMTVQLFSVKDCCTEQMLEYSCSTLLIQPK